MKYLITLLGLVFSINANATLLTIDFDDTDYAVGDTVTGQLVISKFPETLAHFAGEVTFDDSSLSLTGWTFGNGFDDGLGSYQFADDTLPGELYLEDVADPFADEATLSIIQGQSFVLASFSFEALTAGMHTVSLLNSYVDTFSGNLQNTLPVYSASFNVTQVPEPTTGLLLLAGLAGLLRRAR